MANVNMFAEEVRAVEHACGTPSIAATLAARAEARRAADDKAWLPTE